ncbi:MAG TPA: hypothetical protein VEL76_13900 [Gemmataceae bacterium]|nr:hypothetical protein [Gemmataceae bacterium]
MLTVLYPLLCAGSLGVSEDPAVCGSYLYQPAYCMDLLLRGPTVPYLPQPGDIMLATDKGRFWRFTHNLAFAGEPHNSAIVFARRDGSLAILEAGPNDCLHVKTLDMLPHLLEYEAKGPVWIRKRTVPLTPEQSLRLTEWAEAVEGRRFALVRLAGQLTLLRSRGPLRTYILGKPQGLRHTYFCSELVTESCVTAGLIDPANARPAATYPSDLFFDSSLNRFLQRHFHLAPFWEPPARWSSTP